MYSEHQPARHLHHHNVPRQAPPLSYSIRRSFVDEFYARHVSALAPHSRVLDLGGTRIQKRGRFDIAQYPLHVVYANISPAKQPDVQADAAAVPFRDARFDAVICAELLEHVAAPGPVLREAHRLLRAGGVFLATVPFLYRIHGDPLDFGRYTDYYWQDSLARVGFDSIGIEPQGLFWSVLLDFARQALHHYGVPRPFGQPVRWLLARAQQQADAYEQRPGVQGDPFLASFSTGFGIVGVKA